MSRHKKLFARLTALAFLVLCLGSQTFAPATEPALTAAPCCQDCPIPPWEVEPTPQEYCTAQCGASSGTCYNRCLNSVYSCWQWCVNCGQRGEAASGVCQPAAPPGT